MSKRAFATIVLVLAACGAPHAPPSRPARSASDVIRERIEGTWIASQADTEQLPGATVERELEGFFSMHDGLISIELRMPHYYKSCSGSYQVADDALTVRMKFDHCIQWFKEDNRVDFGLVWDPALDPTFVVKSTDKPGEIVLEAKEGPRRFLFRTDNVYQYHSTLHPPNTYLKAFRRRVAR